MNEAATKKEHNREYREKIAALHAPYTVKITTILSLVLLTLLMVAGWQNRNESYITAESGQGYWLGVIGTSMMLLLLLYPLRKKARFMRNMGPIRYWFRIHMILGVLGPTLILFHCNFHLGSLNSNVALFSMIIVSWSGLAGRYFYTKIHYGLYGSRASLQELGKVSNMARDGLTEILKTTPEFTAYLQQFETMALTPAKGLLHGIWCAFKFAIKTRWAYFRLNRILKRTLQLQKGLTAKERRQHIKTARRYLSDYLKLVRKTAEFTVYERLFSLWHLLHMPLFIMLVISSLVHIYAVHVY